MLPVYLRARRVSKQQCLWCNFRTRSRTFRRSSSVNTVHEVAGHLELLVLSELCESKENRGRPSRRYWALRQHCCLYPIASRLAEADALGQNREHSVRMCPVRLPVYSRAKQLTCKQQSREASGWFGLLSRILLVVSSSALSSLPKGSSNYFIKTGQFGYLCRFGTLITFPFFL